MNNLNSFQQCILSSSKKKRIKQESYINSGKPLTFAKRKPRTAHKQIVIEYNTPEKPITTKKNIIFYYI